MRATIATVRIPPSGGLTEDELARLPDDGLIALLARMARAPRTLPPAQRKLVAAEAAARLAARSSRAAAS